jgi:hypothetical protein
MSRSPYDPSGRDFDPGPRPRLQCGCGVTFVREVAGQWQCRPCIGGYGSQPDGSSEGRQKLRVFDGGARRFPPVVVGRSELPPDTDPWAGQVFEPAGYEAPRASGETGSKRRARSAPLWTDTEVELLREHYPVGRIVRLLRLLRGRTREAIQTKAHAIGLRLDKSREFEGSRRSEMLKRAAGARREERSEWDGLVLEPAGEQ